MYYKQVKWKKVQNEWKRKYVSNYFVDEFAFGSGSTEEGKLPSAIRQTIAK